MKKILFLLCTLMLLPLLSACGKGGNTDHVQRNIGSSQIYTEEEILEIMGIVENFFEKEFAGCTLTELTYDEERSNLSCDEWADTYQAKQAIIFYSTFQVDASGGDGSLNPNSTYTNWNWILTKDNSNKWTLKTWGY